MTHIHHTAARTALFIVLLLSLSLSAFAHVKIDGMTVEYETAPVGIDVAAPRFGWQMTTDDNTRGLFQKSYNLTVKDEQGQVVWTSGTIRSDKAVAIAYGGEPLKAATRYEWTVRVADNRGVVTSGTSHFETGLMNPDLSAWNGAGWIGGGAQDMVLYSHYLPIYTVRYALTIAKGSTRASFILGANDSRLMDRNKNLYGIASAKDSSYIKVEWDIADALTDGQAKIHIYRAGYTDTDRPDVPIKTFLVKREVINSSNAYGKHTFTLHGQFGQITTILDGNENFYVKEQEGAADVNPYRNIAAGATVNLNPMGQGGDYITYGQLCDIGFSLDAGQQATFSDIEIRNRRMPENLLCGNDFAARNGLTPIDGAYTLSGGTKGYLFTADPSRNAMPMLRTEFEMNPQKQIAKGRLYITARGIYEAYLNGRRVGNDYYNPGLTQYNKTHCYQTYDVTDMLRSGRNALGAMLGEGWWSGLLSFGTIWNHFGDRQSLLAQLVITFTDGSKQIITTNDRDWRYGSQNPILYSSLDMGEVYDATREAPLAKWQMPSFDDSRWHAASIVPLQGTAFIGSYMEIGRETELNYDSLKLIGQIGRSAGTYAMLTARSVKEVRPGVFVYDMGQNFVGVPKITLRNGEQGRRLTLRYAEMLYPDQKASGRNVGMIMTENYRAALCQDIYIEKAGAQTIQPHFTSRGYQYVEITGLDEPLPLTDVQGVVISSVHNLTASYTTSNEKVNRLWKNICWSNIDNFLTIPTDCPQRNERMGWSGDISVFSPAATYISNADQFLTRHLQAMRDVQSADGRFTDVAPVGGGFGGILWGSAGITVPWEVYRQYGDLKLLRQHYAAMTAYMNYIGQHTDKTTGRITDAALGDWLGPQNNQLGSAFLATAYQVYDLDIMRQTAELLGETADAQAFRKQYDERKAFFNKTFVNSDGKALGLIEGGWGMPADTKTGFQVADIQTAYAVGLALNAFRDDLIPVMRQNLLASVQRENRDDAGVVRPPYSLMTGFIGTAWISKALSDCDLTDAAYRLLQTESYPSWIYPVNQGATTIWERLNGYTIENGFGGNNGMNSFNHYSFGAVGRWMIAYSLGIQRDEPGFRKFILQPEPDPSGQMTHAEGYYDSPYGRIESAWSVNGTTLEYKATVPPNTTAQLILPATSADGVREGDEPAKQSKGIQFVDYQEGKAVYILKSGSYRFTTTIAAPAGQTGK